ncbi:hypothetical protein [Mucilaginibacter sp. HD30]
MSEVVQLDNLFVNFNNYFVKSILGFNLKQYCEMIGEYELGLETIDALIDSYNESDISLFNEAKTRLSFIDKILTGCLAWAHSDIDPEDSFGGSFCDYKLNLFRPVAVWEAKRTNIYFELPIGVSELILPIKTIAKGNPKVKDALKQVSSYCHERGIQIGVVCNGWQIIAFVANRNDSVPPLEGNALVVSSLNVFKENFKDVWNCLSKPGIEEKHIIKKLLGDSVRQLPPKLSSTIYQYPGIQNRNTLQTELEILSDLVLEDVIKDKDVEKDFLEDCYCKSGALSQYSLVSKDILTTRYNYLFEENDRKATLEQVATKKGLSPELVELFANSLSKRPILLIGDVGVGKSTFIDNLLLVEAPRVFEKSITFKIDLGSRAIISVDIKEAILKLIDEQLKFNYNVDVEDDDFVRHCYYIELENFKKNVRVKRLYDVEPVLAIEKEVEYLSSLVEDRATHLKKALLYISKSQKRQIIVFIDNCDQRNDQDQETAFLVAQELATDWPVIAFLCLRPETFHRTKKSSGALSGYHTKAFTISPPRIDDVIIKRLQFAQKITSGEINLSRLENKTSFSKLDILIETFKDSLRRNNELFKLIDNISNGNIRKAVELIKKFFASAHVDTEKIIKIAEESGYLVPVHELLRAIIFNENVYYDPSSSEIVNLLDVRTYDPKEHFLTPLILGLLFDRSKNNRDNGFVSIADLYSHVQSFGFNVDQIDNGLNFIYSKNLLELSQKGNALDIAHIELLLRITNSGIYHLCYLLNSFTYIDAIVVDVPVFDENLRGLIINVQDINGRIQRALTFKNYLDQIWQNSDFVNPYFDWRQRSAELEKEIQRILERLNKNANSYNKPLQ